LYYTITSNTQNLTVAGNSTLTSVTTTPLPSNLSITVPSANVIQFTNSAITTTSSPAKKSQLIPSAASGIGLSNAADLTVSPPTYNYNNSLLISSNKFGAANYTSSSTSFTMALPYTTTQVLTAGSPYIRTCSDTSAPVILGVLNLTFDSNAFI
jgi:hypothetical protein